MSYSKKEVVDRFLESVRAKLIDKLPFDQYYDYAQLEGEIRLSVRPVADTLIFLSPTDSEIESKIADANYSVPLVRARKYRNRRVTSNAKPN